MGLSDQNDDELKELLALAWLGRGDFSLDEWQDTLDQLRDVRQYHTPDYLLGTPLLAEYLEAGPTVALPPAPASPRALAIAHTRTQWAVSAGTVAPPKASSRKRECA